MSIGLAACVLFGSCIPVIGSIALWDGAAKLAMMCISMNYDAVARVCHGGGVSNGLDHLFNDHRCPQENPGGLQYDAVKGREHLHRAQPIRSASSVMFKTRRKPDTPVNQIIKKSNIKCPPGPPKLPHSVSSFSFGRLQDSRSAAFRYLPFHAPARSEVWVQPGASCVTSALEVANRLSVKIVEPSDLVKELLVEADSVYVEFNDIKLSATELTLIPDVGKIWHIADRKLF
ncbi:hypothetical protein EDB19DRAFT_1829220 [Suillus lakei]|nr:hypothetical protein EDB19DRAFT_1829220 [Suillus lakei]